MFNLMDKHLLSGYISSFGNMSSLVFVIISFFKFLIFPLKEFLVIFSGIELFSVHEVFVLYYFGIILSSIFCYEVGKILSNTSFTQKLFLSPKVKSKKFQLAIVFVSSIFSIPLLDSISYIAGLLEFDFKKYMVTRLIAKVPMTLIYINMGNIPSSSTMNMVYISFLIISFGVIYLNYKNTRIKGEDY